MFTPTRVVYAAVVTGICCRVVQYLWNLSFWGDEASIVLNVRTKAAAQLMGPLDFNQAAPPLFLLAERGVYRLLGGSEWSLRLLSLLAGCTAIVLFAGVARRLLSPWAAAIALGIFAWSERLTFHTVEVKQYGIDVFVAVALVWIATRPNARGSPVQRLLALCVAGALVVWCSYPAIFVFAGLSLALLPTFARLRWRGLAWYAFANSMVGFSFLLLLRLAERAQHTQYLDGFWAAHFISLKHPLSLPAWFAVHFFTLCNYPSQPDGLIVLSCAIAGAIWLAQTRRLVELALVFNPLAMNLLAAALGRYPFDGGRLTLYLAPNVDLLAGCGAVALYLWLRPAIGPIGFLPAVLMLGIAAGGAALHAVEPRQRGHVRPVVAFIHPRSGAGDGIYTRSRNAFEAYWPVGNRLRQEMDYADQIPFKRFWIVWSDPSPHEKQRLDRVVAWARTFAAERESYVRNDNYAYFFEIRDGQRPHSLQKLGE